MEIRVNATRQELMRLKNRFRMAKRGHKLLKDKRDELMRIFMQLLKDNRQLRQRVEEKLSAAYSSFLVARSTMDPQVLEEALMSPTAKLELKAGTRTIMNAEIPVLEAVQKGNIYSYGLADTSAELDEALANFSALMPDFIKLAEMERTVEVLAGEIEKTRRRVNALEYVLIPELESTVNSIEMRLAEIERSNASRLMKIKDIVRAH
ncbi:MAG TPA: V-type ATP synthase subunit D [Firmicutes bacterium]|nr:V-type ATP synthase subunit D [Bacillota bacterium]